MYLSGRLASIGKFSTNGGVLAKSPSLKLPIRKTNSQIMESSVRAHRPWRFAQAG